MGPQVETRGRGDVLQTVHVEGREKLLRLINARSPALAPVQLALLGRAGRAPRRLSSGLIMCGAENSFDSFFFYNFVCTCARIWHPKQDILYLSCI